MMTLFGKTIVFTIVMLIGVFVTCLPLAVAFLSAIR